MYSYTFFCVCVCVNNAVSLVDLNDVEYSEEMTNAFPDLEANDVKLWRLVCEL